MHLSAETVMVLRSRRATYELEQQSVDWVDPDLVFCSERGTPLPTKTIRTVRDWIIQRIGKKNDDGSWAEQTILHNMVRGLRYTNASLMALRKVDKRTLADRFAHTGTRMLDEVYQQTYEEQQKAAALPMSKLLGKARRSCLLR